MPKLFDRVKVNIPTGGTGSITFGPASSTAFLTPTEAGAIDGDTVRYILVDGTDFEEGVGTIFSSAAQMARTTVTKSKIAGVVGSTKLNLSGTAVLAFTASASDILNPANNLADLLDKAVSRTNLGISAANTPFAPGGTIAATNVQAAIAELDSETQAAIIGLQGSRVRFDIQGQGLSAAQMVNARVNIGAIGVVRRTVFTASGTFTPHAQMVFCHITAVGGGGGGGGLVNDGVRVLVAGGGGGGVMCERWATSAEIGASRAVTIGAGGSGGAVGRNNGFDGGVTIMASIISAGGGGGGWGIDLNGGGYQGRSDGVSSGGIVHPGGAGGHGFYFSPSSSAMNFITYQGVGGNSWIGLGASAATASGGVTITGNSALANTGGGGSGAASVLHTGSAAGGNGGSGLLIVDEFCMG
jgi:hypothetical protein